MRRPDERGAGTVLAAAMIGLLVLVTLGASGAVGVVACHRRAQAAADLAALAGAAALQEGGDACRRAGAVARLNGAELRECQVDGWVVSITVTATLSLSVTSMDLPARGRAGPAAS